MKDCTESVDKFTLVLNKQKENLEYLVGRAGERAALADQLQAELDLTNQRRSQLERLVQK